MSSDMQRDRLRRGAIKLVGDKTSALGLARGRLVIIKGFFILVFLLVGVRAIDLSILQSKDAPTSVKITSIEGRHSDAPIMRGAIYDRNNVKLATTLKTASLYADPYLISDATSAAQQLVKVFPDLSYGKVLEDLQSKKRFVWLKRGIMPAQQLAVLEIGEPGLEFEYEYARFYPQSDLFSHVIGYTDVDGSGIAGIEKSFNRLLASGQDIHLSIDMRLQHLLRRETLGAINEYSAVGGSAVVMNIHTGEVLASVSLPDFNLNNMTNVQIEQKFNRMTLGTYELGSVFKIFSTAAFLENYDVPMSTTFDTTKPLKRGRFTIKDYHPEPHPLTIPEIFMHSSNIGSAMMGEAVGTEKLSAFYKDLGLTDPLDIEVPEKGRPQVPKSWSELNTLTASYGHGIAVTPLHVATAVATIVNDGLITKPTYIRAENDGPQKSSRLAVISPETSLKMRQLLRLVVTDGTGGNAEVEGYVVGGKTGTAEKVSGRGYNQKSLISSFVGVFPMNNPQYLIYIAIDEPKGTKKSYGYATGGWVAAPAVAKVISGMATLMALPSQNLTADQDVSHDLKQYVSLDNG